MRFSIIAKEKREIPAAEVAAIAKHLKEKWEKTEEVSVFAYDVLLEAQSRGLIDLPTDWSVDEAEEELVTDEEIEEAVEDEAEDLVSAEGASSTGVNAGVSASVAEG